MQEKKIRIALVGVGNCADSLIQGIHHYIPPREEETIGLMHPEIGGYRPSDIVVAAAFDIDRRKVGKDLSEAMFSPPNCTAVFEREIPFLDVPVRMGQILDGVPGHLAEYPEDQRFLPADAPEPTKDDIVRTLRESEADILINYLPVGSEKAARFYAECAIEARLGFINCIPVFIASDPEWAARFAVRNLPVIGDDIKSQIGATIIHRTLCDLMKKRGVKVDRTYQLNVGGNTDFLNMIDRTRLTSKKASKTEAVQSALSRRLRDEDIHIGPSDYIPWQKDNKICYIRMEGRLFGGVPFSVDVKLSVEDSPNSAGVVIDCIRCCKIARDAGLGGPLTGPSAYFMKHPPEQHPDHIACHMTETFIREAVNHTPRRATERLI
jgi:myo-inositol-1-phosphate synthase